MKPRPPARRTTSARSSHGRGAMPPDVPEVAPKSAARAPDGPITPAPADGHPADPIPEHIRRMLEAAYT